MRRKKVSVLRIYRNDIQQFNELSVTVDLFFSDCMCLCVWVSVWTLYICTYEYCKCCFYVFPEWMSSHRGRWRTRWASGPQDVFVKLEMIPGFSLIPSFLLEKRLAAKFNNSSANLSFTLRRDTPDENSFHAPLILRFWAIFASVTGLFQTSGKKMSKIHKHEKNRLLFNGIFWFMEWLNRYLKSPL